MRESIQRRTAAFLALVLFVGLDIWLVRRGVPYVGGLLEVLFGAACLLLLIWVAWRMTRALLWKVSRRLAFSYFLIGVLPVPMLLLLLGVGLYLLSGFFLGHLYRDAIRGLHQEVEEATRDRADAFARAGKLAAAAGANPARLAFGYYRNGRR
ncbi:MAG: hypothetical protein M3O15_09640, partial [Acidobacteriota bacterium]|nr:hypothetical protein [Acidobacteriota bacterium]